MVRRLMWWIPPLVAAATAVLFSIAGSVATLSEPLSGRPGAPARAVVYTSLRSEQGSWIITPLLIPLVLALLPLIARDPQSRRAFAVLSAALLAVFYLIGSMTIGPLYIPTLITLVAVIVIDRLLPASSVSDATAGL